MLWQIKLLRRKLQCEQVSWEEQGKAKEREGMLCQELDMQQRVASIYKDRKRSCSSDRPNHMWRWRKRFRKVQQRRTIHSGDISLISLLVAQLTEEDLTTDFTKVKAKPQFEIIRGKQQLQSELWGFSDSCFDLQLFLQRGMGQVRRQCCLLYGFTTGASLSFKPWGHSNFTPIYTIYTA